MRLCSLLLVLPLCPSLFAQKYQDIYVSDKVMVQRCVIGDTGSRMIAVGYPGGFNFAFDAVRCTPVFAWFGGYLDFSREANGRGGGGCKILGVERSLGTDAVSFRVGNAEEFPKTLRFQGYRRDSESGEPTFQFEVDGISIEQRVSSNSPDTVKIELMFPKQTRVVTYYRLNASAHSRVELSEGLSWAFPGVVEIPAKTFKAAMNLILKPTSKTFTRKEPDLSGEQIFKNYCSACHSTDGSKLIGPSFEGLWGRTQTVVREGNAEIITIDEPYLRESIMEPQAAVVTGFELVPMADFSSMLTESQVDRLVSYLRTLE